MQFIKINFFLLGLCNPVNQNAHACISILCIFIFFKVLLCIMAKTSDHVSCYHWDMNSVPLFY